MASLFRRYFNQLADLGGPATVAVVALLAPGFPVLAQSAPDFREVPLQERERVAKIADMGFEMFERGDFAGALAKFEEAEAALSIPTFTLQRALTLEQLGRLTEAYKACERAAQAETDDRTLSQHLEAKRLAEVELARLAKLAPTLRISIRGGVGTRQLELDGRPIGFTGDPIRLDPGRHVLRGKDPQGSTAEAIVDVKIGTHEEVLLVFGPTPAELVTRNVWIAVGYGAIGLSGAALAVAIGTGVAAIGLESDIEARCPGGGCPAVRLDEDELALFRVVAISAAATGAVASALGVTAVVVGGRDPAVNVAFSVHSRGTTFRIDF